MEIKITDKMPLEKAIKILKKKMIKEGIFKELKSRRYYEKPSVRKTRKAEESIKRKNKSKRRNYNKGS